jgi:hypothetical protein
MIRALASAILLLSLSGLASATTENVTACPATVSAGATGVLQADLNCTTSTGTGYVVLGQGATLNLNGHSLTFNPGDPATTLVSCDASCTVIGPGTLTSTSSSGSFASIWVPTGKTVKVSNVVIDGMYNGIVAINGKALVTDTSISAVQWGIAGVKKAKLDNVTIAVTTPGGYCIGATDEMGSGVVGSTVTLTSCADGIWASKKVVLTGLTATSNTGVGIYSGGKIVLRDSTVTGSGVTDLLSVRRPVLVNSTCDHSTQSTGDPIPPTWGVCASD